MEIHITNLDPNHRKDQVEKWLTPSLTDSEIYIFDLHKTKGKPWANLIVTDAAKAQSFLAKVRIRSDLPRHPYTGRVANLARGNKLPDQLQLKILRTAESERKSRESQPALPKSGEKHERSSDASFPIRVTSIECGRWEGEKEPMEFVQYYKLTADGAPSVRNRALVLDLSFGASRCPLEIKFDHTHIQSILLSRIAGTHYLIISLVFAPRIYGPPSLGHYSPSLVEDVVTMLQNTGLQTRNTSMAVRHSKLPGSDDLLTGVCLTYRLQLDFRSSTNRLQRKLAHLIPRYIPIYRDQLYDVRVPPKSMTQAAEELAARLCGLKFSFPAKFQIQSLWANAMLSPGETLELLPNLVSIRDRFGDDGVINALRSLYVELYPAEPHLDPSECGIQQAQALLSNYSGTSYLADKSRRRNQVSVHRVTVTPAGVYLYGPDYESSNRVTRQYSKYETYFMRVSFLDEFGDRIQFSSEASNDVIFRSRFEKILQHGLIVAGEHFDFLGFSHSSLRSQSCWFMRPFSQGGSRTTAQVVIQSLGDFSSIFCPAKCAARIGQAFSDTQKGITVNPSNVRTIKDIERKGYVFTDGCGTISEALWLKLRNFSAGNLSTLFQIRYKGAKGMLSLDSRLKGEQIRLRESMVKFQGSPANDLEICGTNSRHLLFKLNRQIIKILEDLGVKEQVFQKLQEKAVDKLKNSARSAGSAIDFLCFNLSDSSTGIAELVKCLKIKGIDATEDEFIRDVLRTLIEIQLREIKFRARIPVQRAVTLYGICDETGYLGEGQVCVTFETGEEDYWLNGRIAVTRSPALHPGDVQVVEAIIPPVNSSLRRLTNCVIFSQHGDRDLPNMLSGGDLDGDLFNVIYDAKLIPQRSEIPAKYPRVEPVEIGRPVTSSDMARFFVDFMESDQLGRIANLHQVFADLEPEGTRSAECLRLAALHSAAVDFSKSGRAVDSKEIPRSPPYRPDFMAPSASTKIERDLRTLEISLATGSGISGQYRYYPSQRVLGKLYRAINEDDFFEGLEDENGSIFSHGGNDCVIDEIWNAVSSDVQNIAWMDYLDTAQSVKDHYEWAMQDIMAEHALGGRQSLTEKEVLIGNIVGKPGASNKHQREQSELMKAKYKREVQALREWMRAETNNDADAYLALAVACLSICTSKHQQKGPEADDQLKSFAWIAAAICVPRLVNSDTSSAYAPSMNGCGVTT